MQNQQTTVSELQEAINRRMGKFANKDYKDTEFHAWAAREIEGELKARGIRWLKPCVWGIMAHVNDQKVEFWDRIAETNIEFKRDKRCTVNGRGKVLSMKVAFWAELLPLSLEEARKALLERKRRELMAWHRDSIEKKRDDLAMDEKELARLEGLRFE